MDKKQEMFTELAPDKSQRPVVLELWQQRIWAVALEKLSEMIEKREQEKCPQKH